MKPEELEALAEASRELGLSCEETVKLFRGVMKGTDSVKSLWGKRGAGAQKGSRLIKLGVSLIAFPIPTIGIKKSLGAVLIAAGLLQERRRHIHVADVYAAFQDIHKQIETLRQR